MVMSIDGAKLDTSGVIRRRLLAGFGAVAACGVASRTSFSDEQQRLRFGLTPVFLSNDLDLLSRLQDYLESSTGDRVELVTRRTYQEITALLVSSQIEAAWICGYPFVQFRSELDLVATPVWKGKPLYQSYIIAAAGRTIASFDDLRGDIHAFSDPNSNSGYLVTRALMAEKKLFPETFFKSTFFTYGHRNVIRAVASGLAQSGSVDGYVWEVMKSVEPELVSRTGVIRRSEWLGFPPVACPAGLTSSPKVERLRAALLSMADHAAGRAVLDLLQLDGFANPPPSLFDAIAAKMNLVRGVG